MPQQTSNEAAPVRIAYITRSTFDDGKAFRAGVLVVDERGTPLEFRCTSPVRPNAVQRITYGDSLEPYMLVELMAKPLLRAVRERINLVLVDEPTLLGAREHVDPPLLFVRRQGAEIAGGKDGSQESATRLIDSSTGRFDAVVIQAFPNRAVDVDVAFPVLDQSGKHIDILEPFQRVRLALAKVHEEKTLDRS